MIFFQNYVFYRVYLALRIGDHVGEKFYGAYLAIYQGDSTKGVEPFFKKKYI